MRFPIWALSFSASALIAGVTACGVGSQWLSNSGVCEDYPDGAISLYRLPYAVGQGHKISQGNCGTMTHYGRLRYSIDFDMAEGTAILASRAGTVIKTSADGEVVCAGNYVYIAHEDGTIGRYLHLSRVDVATGATATLGMQVGLSGATGCTGTFPHLHFDVVSNLTDYSTQKINFNNAGSVPYGLIFGETYVAQ